MSGYCPTRRYRPGYCRTCSIFTWDTPVVKVNYALDAPIPWRSKSLKGAGTVHLGADSHGLIR